jgi:hypothetical protein
MSASRHRAMAIVACALSALLPSGLRAQFAPATVQMYSIGGRPGSMQVLKVAFISSVNLDALEHVFEMPSILTVATTAEGAPRCTARLGSDAARFAFLPAGCTPDTDCRAVQASLPAAAIPAAAPQFSILYECDVTIAAAAPLGDYPIPVREASAHGPEGAAALLTYDGRVKVFDAAPALVELGMAQGRPGETVTVSARLRAAEGTAVWHTRNEIEFDPATPIRMRANGGVACTANRDLGRGTIGFAFRPVGCVAAQSCRSVLALMLRDYEPDPIRSGSLLYRCEIAIDATAAPGTYPLAVTDVYIGDEDGGTLFGEALDGAIVVEGPATPTPTETTTPPPSPTPSASSGGDGCQTAAPGERGVAPHAGLLLLLLAWRAQRRRPSRKGTSKTLSCWIGPWPK